jgi:hypothetical protein
VHHECLRLQLECRHMLREYRMDLRGTCACVAPQVIAAIIVCTRAKLRCELQLWIETSLQFFFPTNPARVTIGRPTKVRQALST